MFENLPQTVTVFEVGPRDGLQNEATQVSVQDKIALIEALADAGLSEIEITSFVSPKWIPQLADAREVAYALLQDPARESQNKRFARPNLNLSALVPNIKGYETAKETGLKQINLFLSASEAHSKKNINKSVAEAMSVMGEVASVAKADGKRVRCYVSTVWVCPYQGQVDPRVVLDMVPRLFAMGIDEISLGDTVGAATPKQVFDLVNRLGNLTDLSKIALHFHDTRGGALANVVAGLEAGVTIFDSSIGGLGGCPYAPGASGNLATEDLVYMLHGMGVKTGVDLQKLTEAGSLAQNLLHKTLPGRYLKAHLAQSQKCEAVK